MQNRAQVVQLNKITKSRERLKEIPGEIIDNFQRQRRKEIDIQNAQAREMHRCKQNDIFFIQFLVGRIKHDKLNTKEQIAIRKYLQNKLEESNSQERLNQIQQFDRERHTVEINKYMAPKNQLVTGKVGSFYNDFDELPNNNNYIRNYNRSK